MGGVRGWFRCGGERDEVVVGAAEVRAADQVVVVEDGEDVSLGDRSTKTSASASYTAFSASGIYATREQVGLLAPPVVMQAVDETILRCATAETS